MAWASTTKQKVAKYLDYPLTDYYLNIINQNLVDITDATTISLVEAIIVRLDECETNLQSEASGGSFEKLDVITYGGAGAQTGWLRERARLVGILSRMLGINIYQQEGNSSNPYTTTVRRV